MNRGRRFLTTWMLCLLVLPYEAQAQTGTVLVRHAPTINGRVEGSIQMMTAENVTVGQDAGLSGNLLLPGTPAISQHATSALGIVLEGPGAATPSSHSVESEGTSVIKGELRQQDGRNSNRDATPIENRSVAEPTLIEQLRGIADLANRPIEFYGKVVDQDNAPISGVKITLQIRAMKEGTPGVVADLFEDIVVNSDSNGRFSLTEAKGSVLTVMDLEKAGYDPSKRSTNRSYRYWDDEIVRFKADAGRPEVFRMWKKRGAEPLEHAKRFYGIVPDGRSYTIDIIAHKKTEGESAGDLKVTIQRPAKIRAREKYDWSCMIEAIEGGLIESDAEQMYFAPEVGYQQRCKIVHMATDPAWAEREKRQFYLQSRSGRVYARLEVEILSNYRDQAIFSVEYYANPSGSRNLEYDPLQGVRMSPSTSR